MEISLHTYKHYFNAKRSDMTNWTTNQKSNQKLSHIAIYHISHFLLSDVTNLFQILHCTMEFSAIKNLLALAI